VRRHVIDTLRRALSRPSADPAIAMALSQKEADVQMMLAAQCHLGTKNCDFQMERYTYKRRNDGA